MIESTEIAASAVLYAGVSLGPGSTVGEFALLGVTPRGRQLGDLETRIGQEATIRSHTVIYAGNKIGERFQTGHAVLVRENSEIGDDVSIGTHTVVEHHVRIGDRVRVQSDTIVPEYTVLEDDVWVGPSVVMTNARYPASPRAKAHLRGPHVMQGAKIGGNATVLPGVMIGRNALVGAGSVVVHDVPDDSVVVGNPARVIGKVTDLAAYQARSG